MRRHHRRTDLYIPHIELVVISLTHLGCLMFPLLPPSLRSRASTKVSLLVSRIFFQVLSILWNNGLG